MYLWEQSLLAMNDNAEVLKNCGAWIASKLCSHRQALFTQTGFADKVTDQSR